MTSPTNEHYTEVLPEGLSPANFSNMKDYERLWDDPNFLAAGNRLNPEGFDQYKANHEAYGKIAVGILLLWHKDGSGFSVFPLLYARVEDKNGKA